MNLPPRLLIRAALAALLLVSGGCRSSVPDKPIGELSALAGEVVHESQAKDNKLRAVSHEPLFARDGITVSSDGEAAIVSGRTVQRLGPGTRMRVAPEAGSSIVEVVELLSGLATFLVDSTGDGRTRFEVRSRGAVLTVKGTLFRVDATGADLAVEVLTGTVEVKSGAATRAVTAGLRAVVKNGSIQTAPLDANVAIGAQNEFMGFRVKVASETGVVSGF